MKRNRATTGPLGPGLTATEVRPSGLQQVGRIPWPKRRWIIASAVAVGVSFLYFAKPWRGPAPDIPVPARVNDLEPQLRDYIDEKIQEVRKDRFSVEHHTTLGLAYAANALWLEASLAFSNVVRLNPDEPLARLYIAVAAQELGDLAGASRQLNDLTARFPAFAPGWYRLGEVSLRLGEVADSERAFQRLIEIAPREWRGYAGLGETRLRQNKYAESAKLLERAVALTPEAKSAHNLLGLAYRALGRMDEARIEMMLGINAVSYPMEDGWSKQVPQHMKLLQDLFEAAEELAQAGEPARAVALLDRALAYHPEHLGLLNNLAIALNRAGEPIKAQAVLRRALRLNDQYVPAHITLSFSCQMANMSEAALAAAERAVALSPNTAQPHLAKANAFLGMGRDQEALAELEIASKCDPKNAEIEVEMGDVCWRNLGWSEKGLEHYRAATNLNPALPSAYVRLGDFYLQQSDTNAVGQVLHMLRRLAPDSPDLRVLEQEWKTLGARAVPSGG